MALHTPSGIVSDTAVFVLKRDIKIQPTNQPTPSSACQKKKKKIYVAVQ